MDFWPISIFSLERPIMSRMLYKAGYLGRVGLIPMTWSIGWARYYCRMADLIVLALA